MITKQQVIENLDDIKKYVQEIETKEVKKVKIQIKNRWTGNIIFESEKETYKEAVIEANLREANLIEADLREANLIEANLREADLRGADLREADLSGANLSGANLREADLSGADLREADLSEADLSEANLIEANLRGAEMNCAKFYGKTYNQKILKQNQVNDFLAALGFKIEI